MQNFIFLKVDRFTLKFRLRDILYVQAEKKYVVVITSDKKYVSLTAIGEMEKMLPKQLFCRIHRSYIVSLEHLNKFDSEIAYIGANIKLPIARQFKDALRETVTSNNYVETGRIKLSNGDTNKLLRDIHAE